MKLVVQLLLLLAIVIDPSKANTQECRRGKFLDKYATDKCDEFLYCTGLLDGEIIRCRKDFVFDINKEACVHATTTTRQECRVKTFHEYATDIIEKVFEIIKCLTNFF